MKNLKKTLWSVLLFMATAVQAQTAAEADAARYFTNQAFGWGTCSNVEGKAYVLNGGMRVDEPKTIVLYASGDDDRQAIMDAITDNDIIILDGSKGDFIISKSMSIYGLKNKTIVGRGGARLCTRWYITPELKQALVAANLGQYSSSSGTGGTLSNGAQVDEAREMHTRQTILDFTGDNSEAYRNSGFFQINTTNENIIFRNLVFVGPGSVDVGGADIISNNGATHVWIDHCEFIDGMDGNLDSGKREGSEQFVTYSWNIFRYTDRSYSHPYSNGTGWNRGYLQYVTYSYNIWGDGCNRRLPQADWVYLHMANNYYNCAGNSVAIAVNANSHALIEGNYAASGVKKPFSPGNYSDLYYLARNNYGFGAYNNKSNTSISLEVPYEYPLIPVDSVPAILQGRHGAGATIDDLIEAFLSIEYPSTPEDTEIPELPNGLVYKEITEDWVFLTTADNIAAQTEMWTRGGESASTKAGTIDPTTGETVEKYSGGGIMLKQGNSAKSLATYVTGVKQLTAYGCTAGSTDRTLKVTATAHDGTVVSGKGTSSGYVSTAITLDLDPDKGYHVEYTGVLADNEESGADMVLHGIRFVAGAGAEGIEARPATPEKADVYSIQGILLKRQVPLAELEHTLPRGIYLVNGRKLWVK